MADKQPSLSELFQDTPNDPELRFRTLVLAHMMAVDARLGKIEAALATNTASPAKRGRGRPKDPYVDVLVDVLADLDTAWVKATESGVAKVLKAYPDLDPGIIEWVLSAYLQGSDAEQAVALRALAEARYRDERKSVNPKAALRKAVQRHPR
jgi:hypothetical protein